MAEFIDTPEGKLIMQRNPGGPWLPATEADYEEDQKTGVQQAVGAFGDALQDTGAFVAEQAQQAVPGMGALDALGLNPLAEAARQLGKQNNERQEARARSNPQAVFAGTAIEALLPVPPIAKLGSLGRAANVAEGIAPISRGAAKGADAGRAAIEGAPSGGGGLLGRVAETVKATVDDIADVGRNARKNAPTTAGEVRQRIATTDAIVNSRAGADSVGAARVSDNKWIDSYSSGEGKVSSDLPLSEAEAKHMQASTDVPSEIDAGIKARETAQNSKNTAIDPGGHAQRVVEDHRAQWGNMKVLEQAGLLEEGYKRFTKEAIGRGFEKSQEVFKRLVDNVQDRGRMLDANDPALSNMQSQIDEIDGMVAPSLRTGLLDKSVEQMQELATNPKGVTGQEFSTVYNSVKKARDKFMRPGNANPENSDALNDLLESLTEAMEGTLSKTEKIELRNARRTWGIMSDLTRGKAVNESTGNVNFITFGNNKKRHDRLFATGRSSRKPIDDEIFDANINALSDLAQPLVTRTGQSLAPMIGKALPFVAAGSLF